MSAEAVEKITANWTTGVDTCHDTASDYVPDFIWPCSSEYCGSLAVQPTKRQLPASVKDRAVNYIMTILKRYPFQLWPELSLPMFHRFLDVWNDTGDQRRAMRAI